MNCHLRSIEVINIPNVENALHKLYKDVLVEAEALFGRIESVYFKKDYNHSFVALIQFADSLVHKKVIEFFRERAPLFYGCTLHFKPYSRIQTVLLNHFRKLSCSDYNNYFCSIMEYDECAKRTIIIHNVLNRLGIEVDLMNELKKDESLFGPIEWLQIDCTSPGRTTMANLRYTNPECHEDVIRYYNRLAPQFCGFELFFEPSFRLYQANFKDGTPPSPKTLHFVPEDHDNKPLINCHLRSVLIAYVPCVDNLKESLFKEVLNEAESLFGKILIFDIIESHYCRSTMEIFIQFANTRVHKKVIQHYTKSPPVFYGQTLLFTCARRINYELVQRFYDLEIEEAELSLDEYERRDINIHFVKNILDIDIEQELLNELKKDEAIFGPIEWFVFRFKRSKMTSTFTLRYANTQCHRDVIQYYNHMRLKFHEWTLFFEPSMEMRNKETLTIGKLLEQKPILDFDQREIVIENVLNQPNIEQELEEELSKDECIFGPIDTVRIDVDLYPTTQAYVRYVNRNVHEFAIDYYNEQTPTFHNLPIYFRPSTSLIDDVDQDISKLETSQSFLSEFSESSSIVALFKERIIK